MIPIALQGLVTTNPTPNVVIVWLWLAWIVSWAVAAAWTNKTEKRLGAKSERFYRLAAIVGVIALRVIGSHPTVARVGTTMSKKMKVLAGIVI